MTTPTPIDHWRHLATRFPAIATLVGCGHLPKPFEPGDLVALLARGEQLAESWRGVLRFLLHLWNRHDHPFDLAEVRRWDDRHAAAFTAWVTGEACEGRPCRYF